MKTKTENGIKPTQLLRESLLLNLAEITTIQDWALASGWKDGKSFSGFIKRNFKKRPSKMIIEAKVEKALELLQKDNGMPCFEIALAIGKPDERALNKFIRRQTGNAPSYYRKNNKMEIKG